MGGPPLGKGERWQSESKLAKVTLAYLTEFPNSSNDMEKITKTFQSLIF